MKIVTDTKELRKPLLPTPMVSQEIDEISLKLEDALTEHGGIGLSANQIGLDKRICIINVKDKLILVNPRIVEVSKETVAYAEQCLSLPKTMKEPVKTVRFEKVKVDTDNLGLIEFGPDYGEGGKRWETAEEFFDDEGLLECVCVQHEIDHLNGVLITHSSRRYTTTIKAPKKYGRNERVMVKMPDGSTEFMKYKKAIPFLEVGCEIL